MNTYCPKVNIKYISFECFAKFTEMVFCNFILLNIMNTYHKDEANLLLC
jgi:hypothetical protein